jgi:hypothetical protein
VSPRRPSWPLFENQLVDLDPGLGDPHHRPRAAVAQFALEHQFEQCEDHQWPEQHQRVEHKQQRDGNAGEKVTHKTLVVMERAGNDKQLCPESQIQRWPTNVSLGISYAGVVL